MLRSATLPIRAVCAGILGISLVAGASVPLLAQGQALADVAKKEADRRKVQPPATKVYTNKDLPESAQKPPAPAPATETPAPADPVAAATEQKPEEKQPQGEQKDEAWWKGRITQVREEVRRNQMFAEALQSRINALTRDYTNRDNPPQRRAIGEQRVAAVNELSRVMQDIERGKKQIADIEEEARQANVPPGWLR